MIPVFTSTGFQRFVTERQHAAEVAGKVLRPSADLWRRAEKRHHPILGMIWFAYYFKPKDAQVADWEGRRPRGTDGLLLPARSIQRDIAH